MADLPISFANLLEMFGFNSTQGISPGDMRTMTESMRVYGGLYSFEASVTASRLGTTPVLLSCFTVTGNANGTTPDHATDQIAVNVSGKYFVFFQASFSGTNSAEVRFRLRKDTVETSYGCTRKLGTGGDIGSASFCAPEIDLTAGEVLTVYVETDGAGTDFVIIQDSQLHVRLIG